MKLHQPTTRFNCGIDLHARNMYVCVLDRDGTKHLHRNIKNNDFDHFLALVQPWRADLTVACECTFNWYWLFDACRDAGRRFVLGHALYMSDTPVSPNPAPTHCSRHCPASARCWL